MTVTLKIEITSPLTDEDQDLMAGLALMTVAIANRQQFNAQADAEAEAEAEPQICGTLEYVSEPSGDEATGRVCISTEGHGGRHKFRPTIPMGMN
jgi:hypothetical protein